MNTYSYKVNGSPTPKPTPTSQKPLKPHNPMIHNQTHPTYSHTTPTLPNIQSNMTV